MFNLNKLQFSFLLNHNTTLPTIITYTNLTKKELLTCYNKSIIHNKLQNNLYKYNIITTSLVNSEDINILSNKEEEELFNLIIKESEIKQTVLDKLKELFKLHQSKDISGKTWECGECKNKGLQESRGCPYLNKTFNDVTLYINGKIYTYCPIYDLNENKYLLNNALLSYYCFNKQNLPESGGLYDQTEFFIDTALLIDSLVKEMEAKEMKKMK